MFESEESYDHHDDGDDEQQQREPGGQRKTEFLAFDGIFFFHLLQSGFLSHLHTLSQTAMVVVRFEDNGAQGRRKGQGIERGEADGYCHGDAELAIKCATCAAHERNGDEHSHHDECDGNDGTA